MSNFVQVLQKLLEKLTGRKLDLPEVTQSETGQRQKLDTVLADCNTVFKIKDKINLISFGINAQVNMVLFDHILGLGSS